MLETQLVSKGHWTEQDKAWEPLSNFLQHLRQKS